MASLVLRRWRGGGLRHELPLPAGREKGVGLKGFAVHCTPCFSVHCSRSLPEHCTRSPPVQCTRSPSMHCTTGLSCIARPALHARASCALHTLPSHAVHVRASRAVHSLPMHCIRSPPAQPTETQFSLCSNHPRYTLPPIRLSQDDFLVWKTKAGARQGCRRRSWRGSVGAETRTTGHGERDRRPPLHSHERR